MARREGWMDNLAAALMGSRPMRKRSTTMTVNFFKIFIYLFIYLFIASKTQRIRKNYTEQIGREKKMHGLNK